MNSTLPTATERQLRELQSLCAIPVIKEAIDQWKKAEANTGCEEQAVQAAPSPAPSIWTKCSERTPVEAGVGPDDKVCVSIEEKIIWYYAKSVASDWNGHWCRTSDLLALAPLPKELTETEKAEQAFADAHKGQVDNVDYRRGWLACYVAAGGRGGGGMKLRDAIWMAVFAFSIGGLVGSIFAEAATRAQAITHHAAEWQINPVTGERKFVWREKQ